MATERPMAGHLDPELRPKPDDRDGADVMGSAALRARIRADHREIGRLVDDLLPALIAKLTASGLGEIEVREGGWKTRLRKPASADAPKRGAGWGGAAQGHAGHGHTAGHGPADVRRPCDDDEDEAPEDDQRVTASSPAVGFYHPRRDLTVGMRVRAGDRVGTVDVLGVRVDVTSPVDGIIGASLAEAGEAVEYGQELIRIELPERVRHAGQNDGDRPEDSGAADDGVAMVPPSSRTASLPGSGR